MSTKQIATDILKIIWHGIQRVASEWQWIVRIAVLIALSSVIAAPRVRVILDSPQTVDGLYDHVCVHTRLIDEVEEWVMQRSLQLVREMGAHTIVEFFPWAYIEREDGRYDWSQADRIIRHAENQGLRVIARMGFVPYWARPDVEDDWTTLNYLPTESFDDFAEFVAVFAERYAGTVDDIIIWNEPNLAFEWGYRQVSPEDYAALLATVYDPVKAANPNVTIHAGALAPTLEPEGSAAGLDDLIYLERMLAAGAADHFDVLSMHTYGFTEAAEATPSPDMLNFRRAELLYEILQEYKPEARVSITESGWNDNPRWTKSVRPSQRIAYTLDAFRYADANWDWMDDLCIWAFRYPVPTFSYPDNFTLVTTDFQLKPIYYAIQAYAYDSDRSSDLWLEPPATSSTD